MTDPSKAQRVARRLEGRLGLSSRRWEQIIETMGALNLSLAALLTSYERGPHANQIGDDYVFNAVLLALALFFAGIANRFAWLTVKGALLGMGLLLLLIGLFSIAGFPII